MANAALRLLFTQARKQDGVITIRNGLEAGLTRAQFRYARQANDWQELQSGTFLVSAAKPTFRQRLRAALLAAGPSSAAGGSTAAALMRWDGFSRNEIVLILPRNGGSWLRDVTVHRSRDLVDEHTWNVDGFRTTTAARTLVDLALTCSTDELTTVLNGISRHGGSERLSELREQLKAFAAKRAAPVLEILNDWIFKPGGPESPLESPVLRILREAGYAPTPQYLLKDRGRLIKRFDAAFVDKKVAVEADGFSSHGGIVDFHADKQKRLEAQALGWQIIEVSKETLDPVQLIQAVQQALSRVDSPPLFKGKMPTEQLELIDPVTKRRTSISFDLPFIGPDPFADDR